MYYFDQFSKKRIAYPFVFLETFNGFMLALMESVVIRTAKDITKAPNDMEELIEVIAHRRLLLILLTACDAFDALQRMVRIDFELVHLVPDNISERCTLKQEVSLR